MISFLIFITTSANYSLRLEAFFQNRFSSPTEKVFDCHRMSFVPLIFLYLGMNDTQKSYIIIYATERIVWLNKSNWAMAACRKSNANLLLHEIGAELFIQRWCQPALAQNLAPAEIYGLFLCRWAISASIWMPENHTFVIYFSFCRFRECSAHTR